MRIGVDLGTTRTVVAYVDRGNYPLVSFADADGDQHDFVPSLVALDQGRLVYGWAARAAAATGAPSLRSFKRLLASPDVSPQTRVRVGDHETGLLDLVTGHLVALRAEVAAVLEDDHLEAVAGVPAHAHTAQRFITLEAFRRAGFSVLGMVNEPSAASFEYTHRQPKTVTSRRNQIVVYDLGGGTFDASLVEVEDTRHQVVSSVGLNHLGGDDFDEALAGVAQQVSGATRLSEAEYEKLLDEAREAKERLTPQARRVSVEVAGRPVTVPVDQFYEAAAELVGRSTEAMAPLLSGNGDQEDTSSLAGIYIVGGASALPLVSRSLRERFGRRVHRSPYPGSSTAIGLAIAADPTAGYSLTERLSRGFGVFRELDAGARLGFDQLLDRDQVTSTTGSVVVTRRYLAAHNVGHFLFVEYDHLVEGSPAGTVTPFVEVLFPYDRSLRDAPDLGEVEVCRTPDGPEVEERYEIDLHGMVTVTITSLADGYHQTYALTSTE
ncbi:MAG: Hsp70 family protein [Actinomycetia bacterium]|nr:Hsp70 family protein [Actinomycetes bacterium]